MLRYLFTQDGYRCVDVDGTILHQSDNHEDLYQFVDKDDTPIDDLLREYINSCVNIETLAPIRKKNKGSIYREMLDFIHDLHPFCTSDYLNREIARYLNDRLVELKNASNAHSGVTESQYRALYDSLFFHDFCPPGKDKGHHADQCSLAYASFCRKLTENVEYHTIDAPFYDIHKAKMMISDFLYWVLDSQAEPFGDLPPPQRLYVYNEYHHPDTFKFIDAKVEYYLGNENGIRLGSNDLGTPNAVPLANGGRLAVQGMTTTYSKMDPSAKKLLKKTIAKAKKITTFNEYCAIYSIDDLFTLLFIECQRMYEAKVSIRRCERCGHYFVASKRVYKYCDRYIDENCDQTCRDVGTKESAQKRLDEDPIYYLYHKAYRTHHARIRAGRLTKHEFDAWTTEAKRRMNAAMENPALQDEYAEWLKL